MAGLVDQGVGNMAGVEDTVGMGDMVDVVN